MRKILLTGAEGQVGWELQRTLAPLGHVIALRKEELDLSNLSNVAKVIRTHSPSVIINAAAYTAVDRAESEPEIAMAINGTAPGVMAEEAKRLNALLVHFSTDYVFNGQSTQPYLESDAPDPLNVYGKSKLAGEENIQAVHPRHLILRTSWVYSNRGHNFLKTMLKLATSQPSLNVVSDQFGAPTWSRLLAECTAFALQTITGKDFQESDGIYHLTSSGSTSWYGFAQEIFSFLQKEVEVKAISTEQYRAPAKRPANSVLSNDKFVRTFNVVMPSWETGLKLCLLG